MQKSEKTAEPSMEEILASIRKIIAEEPPQAPQPATAEPLQQVAEPEKQAPETAVPPGGDLSDILDEPAPSASPVGAVPVAETDSQPASNGQQLQSPFPQAESEHETPLMARLRGLAGAPTPAAEPNGSVVPEGPELSEPVTENIAQEARSVSTPVEAPVQSLEIEPELKPGLADALVADAAETVFGKSAAVGSEPVAISIDEEAPAESESLTAEVAEPAVAATVVEEEPSVPAAEIVQEAAQDPIDSPAQAQIDEVFASLTDDVSTEEHVEVEDLPALPHQEAVDSPPEEADPIAAVESVTPVAPVAPPAENTDADAGKQTVSAGGDLEVALAALVEPIVHRWLAENVPALVEQALAEQAKDK